VSEEVKRSGGRVTPEAVPGWGSAVIDFLTRLPDMAELALESALFRVNFR